MLLAQTVISVFQVQCLMFFIFDYTYVLYTSKNLDLKLNPRECLHFKFKTGGNCKALFSLYLV